MTTFFTRRGGPRRPVRPAVPRIGHFYLAASENKLYCLNETARQFVREGVPLTPRDLARQPLINLEGNAVASQEMPLTRAVRDAAAVESVFLLERPDGVTWALAWHASPVSHDGKVSGAFGTLTVPPPEADWEELAGLSHDLRTPLQTIRNLVSVLQSSPLFGPAAEAVDRLKNAADQALSIGQHVVEFCKAPQRGAPRGERAWLALGPVLEKLAAEQKFAALKKGISLETDLAAAAAVEVHTDAGRLARLVSNLLVNAVRYTTAGRVRFAASWAESRLTLSVEDTGAGIAADDPDSIFQAFKRGKAGAGDTDSGGSGMGLAIVDRLVSELDFTLEVYSEHGRGSRFDLILPPEQLRRMPETRPGRP